MPDASDPQLLCPRCRYDLAGIVSSWHDACPLTSLCPECGRTFHPREVIVADRRTVDWSFEHAPHMRPRNAVGTVIRLYQPLAFWDALKHTELYRPHRVLALALLTNLLSVVLCLGIVSPIVLYSGLSPWSNAATFFPNRTAEAGHLLIQTALATLDITKAAALWLGLGLIGLLPFWRWRPFPPRGLITLILYQFVNLMPLIWLCSVLYVVAEEAFMTGITSVLGVPVGVLDVARFVAAFIATVWFMLTWYATATRRLPLKMPRLAWIVSQISAGLMLSAWFILREVF